MPFKKGSSKQIPVPREADLPFQLGDLVLCRYSLYPYWPATIAFTHQKKNKGKHVCMIKGSKDDEDGLLSFWCVFSDEDTGGWVRADRMVKYHPDLVPKIRLKPGKKWTKDQALALQAAERHFEVLNEEKDPPVPTPPADFLKSYMDAQSGASDEDADEDDIDPAEDSDEGSSGADNDAENRAEPEPEQPKLRKSRSERKKKQVTSPKPAQKKTPTPKPKSKRKAPPSPATRPAKKAKVPAPELSENTPEKKKSVIVPDDSPTTPAKKQKKSVRAEPPAPSAAVLRKLEKAEKDLALANQNIAKLKKTLRKRESYLNDFVKGGASIRIFVPPTPDSVDIQIPAAEVHHSKPVGSDGFTDIMNRLNSHFSLFKDKVNTAEQARTKLYEEKKKVEDVLKDMGSKVMQSEQVALENEKVLVGLLEEILLAKVDVEDLRKHKAGNVIRNIGKMCNGMASIASFCNEIYSQWKKIVLAHVKNADANAKTSSTTPAKSTDDVKMKDIEMKDGKPTSPEGKVSEEEVGKDSKALHTSDADGNVSNRKMESDEESKDNDKPKDSEEAKGSKSTDNKASDTEEVNESNTARSEEKQEGNDNKKPKLEQSSKGGASRAQEKSEDMTGQGGSEEVPPSSPMKGDGQSGGKSPLNVGLKTRGGKSSDDLAESEEASDEEMEDVKTGEDEVTSPGPADSKGDSLGDHKGQTEAPMEIAHGKRKSGNKQNIPAGKKPRAPSENGKKAGKADQSQAVDTRSTRSRDRRGLEAEQTNNDSPMEDKSVPVAEKPKKASSRTVQKSDDVAKS